MVSPVRVSSRHDDEDGDGNGDDGDDDGVDDGGTWSKW